MTGARPALLGLLTGMLAQLVPGLSTTALAAGVPDFPALTGASARCVIGTSSQSGVLRYEYWIENDAGTLPVAALLVDLRSDASREVLSAADLDNRAGKLPSSLMYVEQFGPDRLVAVAFPSSAPSWLAGVDRAGRARWGAFARDALVRPGSRQRGFVLLSRGLPTLRNALLEPDLSAFQPSEEERDTLGLLPEDLDDEAQRSNLAIATLGPAGLPTDLSLDDFTRQLVDYVEASLEQGWITSAGVANALQKKLLNLTRMLEKGQERSALQIARALGNQLEGASCRSLTCPGRKPIQSEAYALLRFNLDALLEKLEAANAS